MRQSKVRAGGFRAPGVACRAGRRALALALLLGWGHVTPAQQPVPPPPPPGEARVLPPPGEVKTLPPAGPAQPASVEPGPVAPGISGQSAPCAGCAPAAPQNCA